MFFLFGSFCAIMGVFVWFFIPETKGLSLEKMDELFGADKDESRRSNVEKGRDSPASPRGSIREDKVVEKS